MLIKGFLAILNKDLDSFERAPLEQDLCFNLALLSLYNIRPNEELYAYHFPRWIPLKQFGLSGQWYAIF
ncbi:hypothetical protein ACFOG5_09325 [Pedobacter fastidiosus]|uniref:hypothetical protein n=1 Tax=Pedobacter fastidiosus TaxID=2765361 RepID=UPI00360E8F64